MWVDQRMVEQLPRVLSVHDQSAADRPVHIRRTAGVSGVWTLCWLDTESESGSVTISRLDLLAGLTTHSGALPGGRFAPVFPSDMAPSEITSEMRALLDRHPQHVMAPLFQDSASGRVTWQKAGAE